MRRLADRTHSQLPVGGLFVERQGEAEPTGLRGPREGSSGAKTSRADLRRDELAALQKSSDAEGARPVWHPDCKHTNPDMAAGNPVETTKANQSRPILVIDDDPRFCEWVTAALTGTGFEVLSAPDGSSGIELARTARPAVILLDMLLPGMDGIATCKRLKQDRALRAIPVLGVTAAPDLRYTEQAFHAGAEFFLAKPIRANSLAQVVELAAKRAQRTAGSRAFPRFQVELQVRCFISGYAETTREIAGQTGNVSLDGVLLFLPERLPPGIVLSLRLALPKGPLPAEGTVVWQDAQATCSGRFRHGIRFVRFTDDSGLMEYRRYLSQIATGTSA